MAKNNKAADNDRFFFRNEGLEGTTNVPRDMTWALSEGTGVDTDTPSGGSSYVGEIVYNEKTGKEEWQPYEDTIGRSEDTDLRQIPTPYISDILAQKIYQNAEGVARTSVTLSVICIDSVEYEVVVTPA